MTRLASETHRNPASTVGGSSFDHCNHDRSMSGHNLEEDTPVANAATKARQALQLADVNLKMG